jgi:hypothetical protein
MAKLTKKQFSRINEQATLYRWEFLRRNKNYGEELRRLIKDTEEKKKISPLNSRKFTAGYEWARKAWHDFAKRWGLELIGEYFPLPEKIFNELTPVEKAMLLPYATKPSHGSFDSMANTIVTHNVKILNFPISDGKTLNSINVEVFLSYPHRRIMQELGYIVKIMKFLRDKKGFKDNVKPRYREYANYLKIYDLRMKKKMKYKDICKKIFKNKSEITREDEDKICKAFKKASKLVESDYRNIR